MILTSISQAVMKWNHEHFDNQSEKTHLKMMIINLSRKWSHVLWWGQRGSSLLPPKGLKLTGVMLNILLYLFDVDIILWSQVPSQSQNNINSLKEPEGFISKHEESFPSWSLFNYWKQWRELVWGCRRSSQRLCNWCVYCLEYLLLSLCPGKNTN